MLKQSIIVSLIILLSMCGGPTPKPKYINFTNLRKSVEDRTNYFDPAFFRFKHVALVYKINDEILDPLDSTSLKNKIGKMPAMLSGGPFQVIYIGTYKGFHGQIIKSYYMQNPLYRRIEFGPNRGLKKIKKGSFEVPLPNDSIIISTVILIDNGDTLVKSNVLKLFQKL